MNRPQRVSFASLVPCVLGVLAGCGSSPTTTTPEPETVTFPARDYACADGDTDPSCATTAPTIDEAGRSVSVTTAETPASYVFVVERITLPVAESGGSGRDRAAGFNLDALDTRSVDDGETVCTHTHEDFDSLSDDGVGGVDNAVQGFIPTIEGLLTDCPGGTTSGCLDATLAEQIASGALVLVVQVDEVDALDFDEHVEVRIALGEYVSGTPTLDADGTPAAGQSVRIASDPSGAPLYLGPTYDGDVFDGRLRIHTDALDLSINTGARQLDLTLVAADLRFDLQADGLANGMIGGALPTDDIVAAAAMVAEGAEALVRGVVEDAADIGPSASDSSACTSLSVGIAFEATTAVLAP